MPSQKELAEALKKELGSKLSTEAQLDIIEQAKDELKQERKEFEGLLHQSIAEKGFIISVPNTEVVLFENDDFQILYCNHAEYPGKISFLWAFKRAVKPITARTPITSQGYVAKIMPKEEINILLSTFKDYETKIKARNERIKELEKTLAPLSYIDHLIKKHNIDTKE